MFLKVLPKSGKTPASLKKSGMEDTKEPISSCNFADNYERNRIPASFNFVHR